MGYLYPFSVPQLAMHSKCQADKNAAFGELEVRLKMRDMQLRHKIKKKHQNLSSFRELKHVKNVFVLGIAVCCLYL